MITIVLTNMWVAKHKTVRFGQAFCRGLLIRYYFRLIFAPPSHPSGMDQSFRWVGPTIAVPTSPGALGKANLGTEKVRPSRLSEKSGHSQQAQISGYGH